MDLSRLIELTSGDDPRARVDGLLRVYEEATGEHLRQPLLREEADRVRLWMMHSDLPWVVYRRLAVGANVHASLASKAGFVQQAACGVCDLLPLDGPIARPSFFPISVPPFTKQNAAKRKEIHERVVREMERAVDKREDPRTWDGLPICATVVAVQDQNRNTIDADNAANAILDTLQGTVIVNDAAIQHVSAYRMKAPETKGYYLIGLRPVYPLECDVVDLVARVKDVSPLMGLQEEE
ncbi:MULTISPECIES: hypothetical protein [Streptomyces]|uniref:Uncharacterized protein n=1 Tax=Streptomyces bacillaris TaxID=68179 RepID=A0ABW6E3W3_9ACTN|nr:hypothetical protein [Streptomyces nanshensis]